MEDKVLNVIVAVERSKLAAKDLHYRAKGPSFFALHLLADKVDFGSSIDDLKEAHYLGFTSLPKEMEIAKLVVAKPLANDSDELISLYEALLDVTYTVEDAKREPGLQAGVHAILDSISQTALIVANLINRTIQQ